MSGIIGTILIWTFSHRFQQRPQISTLVEAQSNNDFKLCTKFGVHYTASLNLPNVFLEDTFTPCHVIKLLNLLSIGVTWNNLEVNYYQMLILQTYRALKFISHFSTFGSQTTYDPTCLRYKNLQSKF